MLKFDCPTMEKVPALWQLWQEAFGDEDAYLEIFFSKAFAPERCMFSEDEDGKAAAALYWFDCDLNGQKLAYIFGVSVANAHRGKGCCRALMSATLERLKAQGYQSAVLVPANPSLYAMYEKLGFQKFGGVSEKEYRAAESPEALREIDGEEYERLRSVYLPAGGVVQKGENIAFLAARAHLYAGVDFVLSFVPGMGEFVVELLGNQQKASGIVRALGREKLMVRSPGKDRDFAVFQPLVEGAEIPSYFGIPFDF